MAKWKNIAWLLITIRRNPLKLYAYIQSYLQVTFPSLVLVKSHTTYNQQKDWNRPEVGVLGYEDALCRCIVPSWMSLGMIVMHFTCGSCKEVAIFHDAH